jgi:hypothetical protein
MICYTSHWGQSDDFADNKSGCLLGIWVLVVDIRQIMGIDRYICWKRSSKSKSKRSVLYALISKSFSEMLCLLQATPTPDLHVAHFSVFPLHIIN